MGSGAKEELHRLYEAYKDDVYRYARLMLNDDNDAYDVTQEVFFRAFKGWDTFRQDASEKTWLMRIARNYIFDLIRKQRHTKEFLSTYRPQHVVDEQTDWTNVLMIEEAVTRLKDTYRQVFLLRHVQDISVTDTAKTLGWTPVKVRVTDRRALTKLRAILALGKEVGNPHEFEMEN